MKKGLLTLVLITVFLFETTAAYAAPVYSSDTVKNEENVQTELLDDVADMGLSSEELEFLMNDETFLAQYSKLSGEGWELDNIQIKDVEMPDTGIMPYGTRYVNGGKIVDTNYNQPTKRKTYYNNSVYSSASKLASYVSLGLNFFTFKYSWVASLLFSIPASDFAPCFHTGTQEIVEDSTLQSKLVYVKEGNNYYSGISTARHSFTISLRSLYYDNSGAPHHANSNKDYACSAAYYGSTDAQLIQVAKAYYQQGGKEFHISYPSTVYFN